MWPFIRKFLPGTWLGGVLVACVGWGIAATILTRAHPLVVPANRPVQTPGEGYASSAECRVCHPSQYNSWHDSYHRTMTQVADPANVIPKLEGMKLSLEGWDYRVEREGEAFFVRRRPSNAPDQPFAESRKIVLLTGSHNLQFLWVDTGKGRTLEHFPFGWLVAEKMWAPLTDTFLCPPEFRAADVMGDWNAGCIDCHTTQGRSRPVHDTSFDSRVTDFGIACEACHGEGRKHIAQNRNPLRRYWLHVTGKPDPTMANPARLKGPESALACGQCHSVWAFANANAEHAWREEGVKYRPGQSDLGERFVVEPTKPDHAAEKEAMFKKNPLLASGVFWGDGQVRVVGREYNGVKESPCFKGGEFSCVTCHDMHPPDAAAGKAWAANQLKPAAQSDATCLSCHEPIKARLAAHTHHAPGSAGNSCYDCHLPHTSFGLLRAVRSHQVSKPSVAESVKFGRPNACNLCHLDRPLAWTAEKLQAWYGQKPGELSRDDREIAAGVRWLLQGDAGQRALVAWSMGWAPAQQAAGRDWLAPYLIGELTDPYAAVRFVAGKSLQTLPEYRDFTFNYTAGRNEIRAVATKAYQHWKELPRSAPMAERPAILLNADGSFQLYDYRRLIFLRDNRPMYIIE